jgi:hypothetical protein
MQPTIKEMLQTLIDKGWTPRTLSVALGGYPSQRTLSRYITGESDPAPFYADRLREFYIGMGTAIPAPTDKPTTDTEKE